VSIDASVWDPPLVRQALDELLKRYPMFDLVSIDWQTPETRPNTESSGWVDEQGGPWVIVELGQPSAHFDHYPAWAIWPFAIFKRTGALHTMTHSAVSDDPIWTP
jgi:hypothetical protein